MDGGSIVGTSSRVYRCAGGVNRVEVVMASYTSLVRAHYGKGGLLGKLLAALAGAGKRVDSLSRDDLAPFEEFHTRGREGTREVARLAGFSNGMRVLDVGCGIGGPARTLAAEFGCTVVGVDLVDEFVEAARELTARVGLSDQVEFVQGDALELPFADGEFDAAMLEHVTMNIQDKGRLFRGLARVVRGGGRLAIYEICAGEGGPVHYPVPWASDARYSFVARPQELGGAAQDAGFRVEQWVDVSERAFEWFLGMIASMANRPKEAGPAVGVNLLMGEDAGETVGTLLRNLEEDRVRVVEGVLAFGEGAGN